MANAQRDERGHWTVLPEDGDSLPFNDWTTRQLNALDPVFERAREKCEFDFILCLLRIRSMQDAGWDPYETTLRAIPRIKDLCAAADVETSKHIGLWIYGHILEASEPYELLANLLRVAAGGRYHATSAFQGRGNRPPTPGEKIERLQADGAASEFPHAFTPLRDVWNRTLRNAAFHADYTITRDGLRTLNPPRKYSWDEYDNLINGALAYHTAFFRLYTLHVSSYNAPTEIPVHPDFCGDSEARAVVMVRQDYGVIGVKDAWTTQQIHQGKIPFRIGRFSEDEIKMIQEDPTRAFFPAERQ